MPKLKIKHNFINKIMSRQPGVFVTLLAKIGWVASKDSNGFDVYSIPEDSILNPKPNSWDPSAIDDYVFIDGVSFEEDRIDTMGSISYPVVGNVHLGILNCISPFLNFMMENRSTFIVFPKKTSKEMMIKSILEVFSDKYSEEQLKSKAFVSSNGNRKSRDL